MLKNILFQKLNKAFSSLVEKGEEDEEEGDDDKKEERKRKEVVAKGKK